MMVQEFTQHANMQACANRALMTASMRQWATHRNSDLPRADGNAARCHYLGMMHATPHAPQREQGPGPRWLRAPFRSPW